MYCTSVGMSGRQFNLTTGQRLTGKQNQLHFLVMCCLTYCDLAVNVLYKLSLSILTAISRWTWVSRCLLKERMMEVVVTNRAISRASSSQIITTNKPTSSFFLQAGCPSCRPTNSVKALKGKYHIPWTYLPQAHLGVFQLCLWPLIAPGYLGGRLPCLSSALWCQYPFYLKRDNPELWIFLLVLRHLQCFDDVGFDGQGRAFSSYVDDDDDVTGARCRCLVRIWVFKLLQSWVTAVKPRMGSYFCTRPTCVIVEWPLNMCSSFMSLGTEMQRVPN